jgi:hypothetical protein
MTIPCCECTETPWTTWCFASYSSGDKPVGCSTRRQVLLRGRCSSVEPRCGQGAPLDDSCDDLAGLHIPTASALCMICVGESASLRAGVRALCAVSGRKVGARSGFWRALIQTSFVRSRSPRLGPGSIPHRPATEKRFSDNHDHHQSQGKAQPKEQEPSLTPLQQHNRQPGAERSKESWVSLMPSGTTWGPDCQPAIASI